MRSFFEDDFYDDYKSGISEGEVTYSKIEHLRTPKAKSESRECKENLIHSYNFLSFTDYMNELVESEEHNDESQNWEDDTQVNDSTSIFEIGA